MKFLVFALCIALVSAHVRIQNAAGQTVRNNAQFSVAGPCGGTAAFSGTPSAVTAGTTLSVTINYGTGANGDHASADNVFRGVFLCGSPTEAQFNGAAGNIGTTIAAAGGSTPNGYTLNFVLPTTQTGLCTLSVLDQRQWGGCLDMNIAAAPEPTTSPDAVNGNGDEDENGAGKSGSGNGMSGGAIAGLIIGVVVAAGVVLVISSVVVFGGVGAAYYYFTRTSSSTHGKNSTSSFNSSAPDNNNFGGNSNAYGPPQSGPGSFGAPAPSMRTPPAAPVNNYGPPRPAPNNSGYGAPPRPASNNSGYGAPPRPASNNSGYGAPPRPASNNSGYGAPPPAYGGPAPNSYGAPPPRSNNAPVTWNRT